MGFEPPGICKSQPPHRFHSNRCTCQGMTTCEASGFIPSDPVFSARQQGQNRDNFAVAIGRCVQWILALAILGAALSTDSADGDSQSRPNRRRRRSHNDRGLPPDDELAYLATEYLNQQRQLWPEMIEKGFLPAPTPQIISAMIEDFKYRHRGGNPDAETLQSLRKLRVLLFGLYARFSCENSNPKSIPDQATNCLRDAFEKGVFIPWQFVYCDYSVTGLDAGRLGYSSYKALLEDPDAGLAGTFIDDFTRASRDEIEWWRLGALSRRLRKQLYGASDRFNLSDPNSEIFITIYCLLSRLFIKGLRQKVVRGMKGAARRLTCLGRLPLGFTRRVLRNIAGDVVLQPDGGPVYEPCWDSVSRAAAVMLFKLFYVKSRSAYRITRIFNRLKVDGWDGWCESGIKYLLRNPAYIGVFIWNKTHREFDPETGKWTRNENPMSEWEFHYDQSLAMISLDWWFGTQAKLALMSGPDRPTRNEIQATTLFSGTVVCDDCCKDSKGELKLVRSTAKYKSLGCLNGAARRHGCKLTTSKSTKIVETCLLGYLNDVLLGDDAATLLTAKANSIFEEEAAKPLIDIGPLKAEARTLKAKIDRLVRLSEDDDDEGLCAGYKSRVKELQKTLNAKNQEIHEADRRKAQCPKPLDVDRVRMMLTDLRGLLNQDIPAAAVAIRAITGPIRIRQEKIPGRRKGARWIAMFTPNLIGALTQFAREKGYPESITLEILCSGNWITPETVQVAVDGASIAESLAAQVKDLLNVHSRPTVAAILGVSVETVDNASKLASGRPPRRRPGKKHCDGTSKRVTFRDIAPEIVRRRDDQGHTLRRIAMDLGVSLPMVRRAYDFAHPEIIREAIERGEPPRRGRRSRPSGRQHR